MLVKGKEILNQKILEKLFALFFLFLPFFLFSQNQNKSFRSLNLELIALDKDTVFVQKYIDFQDVVSDSLSLYKELEQIRLGLNGGGYLAASIDSLEWQDSTATAFLEVGRQYEWANLKNGNIEKVFLEQIGFRERLFRDKPFDYIQLRKIQEELLSYAENNGFPFAKVWLDSLVIKEGEVAAQLFMEKGIPVFFKGVETKGSAKITKQYLENYLGIKEGAPYDKNKILQIRQRIKELPFVQEKRTAVVSFKANKATVNLFLEKKKASRFDFLIGLLPGDREDINGIPTQKLLVTGDLTAEMYNQFGKGERIFAEFERLRPSVQELKLEFSYPYVLEMPFGADFAFSQFRRDSSYNDVGLDLGVRYLLEGGNYLKIFYSQMFTNLQQLDTIAIRRDRELPDNLDLNNTGFGLEYLFQKLDYRFNPRRGWSLFFRGNAGIKTITPNSEILALGEDIDFDFQTLYDSLELKSFQYRLHADVAYYVPILGSTTIRLGLKGGYILSEQPIYQNEQFRLGGNRLLRGFDEESIFATIYAVGSLEYRLLIGQNSYFYVFGDYAYLENITSKINSNDNPFGFGGGLTFETGAGIFGVSLAVGSQLNNPIDFRNPKVHFGYISVF